MVRGGLLLGILSAAACNTPAGTTYALRVTPTALAAATATSLQVVLDRSDDGERRPYELALPSPTPSVPWSLEVRSGAWGPAPLVVEVTALHDGQAIADGRGSPTGQVIEISLNDLPIGTDLGTDDDLATPKAPCDPLEAPDTAQGVFVSAQGNDVTGNGAPLTPLQTVAKGLSAAAAGGKKLVYLDEGTYTESLVFTTAESGIIVRGGFKATGGAWTRDCNAQSLTLIRSSAAIAVDVSGTSTTSGLRELTIATKAVGASNPNASGESLYGVRITGASTKFSLFAVSVIAGTGGAGGTASPGVTPPSPIGTCASACSDGGIGKSGMTVSPGGPGSFSQTGFTPGDGVDGQAGGVGHNGVAGMATSNANCTFCASCGTQHCLCACCQTGCGNYCDAGPTTKGAVTTNPGPCGCAGTGASPGKAGRGGGASVALFINGATVSSSYSSFTAGPGGPGSAGGASAGGGAGSAGTAAQASCAQGNCRCTWSGCGGNCDTDQPAVTLTSQPGALGGSGGASSAGGGGAGGASYGAFLFGGATLVDDNTTYATGGGGAGAGGAPAGASAPR